MIEGKMTHSHATAATMLSALAIFAAAPANAQEASSSVTGESKPTDIDQDSAFHGQMTFVLQANAPFHSSYEGTNSLNSHGQAKETFDITLYAGFRPWNGAEIWLDPELDQGFGLSDTLGVAGFPNGEAYKVGKALPYPKLQRWFYRQTIDLGAGSEKVDADLNQLRRHQSENRLVLTLGKFSVVDIFDTNEQAHDPRSDFMNWTIIDAGTFDYAANAWGYTYGAAAELNLAKWAFRAGAFDLSKIPNSEELDPSFSQYELDAEIEHRHSIAGQAGKFKITLYLNHGRMGRFTDAIRLAQVNSGPADIAAVRRMQNRTGISFNVEQQISKVVSLFAKGGIANGNLEPYEFSDVDRTFTVGGTIKGSSWGRDDDVVGIAGVINGITRTHQKFLDVGGLGILIGDGRLPHPGPEEIVEAYYDLAVEKALHVSIDAQFVSHPAYNRDRGPVPIGAVRLHAQF
jgi:high affinity Mn2+ porin